MEMKLKQCSRCLENKQIEEFYFKQGRKDNRDGVCKKCVLIRNRHKYKTRKDVVQSQNRKWRDRNPESFSESKRKNGVKYRAENREKIAAHQKLNAEIRAKRIIRPIACEICGIGCNPHAHHWSYLKEHHLDVIWVCVNCHADLHSKQ